MNRDPDSPTEKGLPGKPTPRQWRGGAGNAGGRAKKYSKGCKEAKGKTHKPSLKGAAPFLSKANCNLYKKIPHLKSFEHFPMPEKDFSFWGRALGLRAWALIFQCFLKTAQGKNTFQGLASIYSTQNHKIAIPATEFPGCLNGQILCPHPNFIFHT